MKPSKILITRPRNDANKILNHFKHQVDNFICEPLIEIKEIQNNIDYTPYDAIILTSANALQAVTPCNLPIYCIGKDTFSKSKEVGFTYPINIDGDIGKLKQILQKIPDRLSKKFLYISGDVITQNIQIAGLNIDRKIVYKTKELDNFSDNCKNAFENNYIKLVTLYSTRTATIFSRLAKSYDLSNISVLCISKKCSVPIAESGFKKIYISNAPNGESMLELIEDISFNK